MLKFRRKNSDLLVVKNTYNSIYIVYIVENKKFSLIFSNVII